MRSTQQTSCFFHQSISLYIHFLALFTILTLMLNLVMVYFLRLFFEFPLGEDFRGFIINYFRQLPKTILLIVCLGLMFLTLACLIGRAPVTTTNDHLIELEALPPPVISTMKPFLPLIIITAPLNENVNINPPTSRGSNQNPGSDNQFLQVPPQPRWRTPRPRPRCSVDSINFVSGTLTDLPGYLVGLGSINESLGSHPITHNRKDI